ncbi:winged helix-turn-helix domain-containing protein [Enterobacter asburiae]|uniref:winged helix-turn-helix domain-containing protein n=1 Tax=Enterobacter asburiae TaxID=61645 RepID=UPI00287827D2|nr:winged helix-turn-helix domain-containing protein [Enterobacter asburiae]MDS1916211.1 winged helix-turn-helix domain-containing protein [Enterobacter asburiae]
MKYVIDNKILFDSDKKELSGLASQGVVVPLTTTASRLLEEMIKHPNRVLPRAMLLKRVWEDNGYAASDASLNNNISVLRKYFSSLSEVEIDLRTVPKIGFQLNATVIEQQDEVPEKEHKVMHATSIQDNTSLAEKKPDCMKRRLLPTFIITLIILFAVMLYTLKGESELAVSQKQIHQMPNFQKCEIFSLSTENITFESVIKAFPLIQQQCSNKSGKVFYDFSSLSKDRTKNLFVSICLKNDKSGYTKCENLKSYSQ